MDRTVDGVLGKEAKYRSEECREFRLAHLAATHGEFAMTNLTEAADMAVDGDVVGRIGEHEFCLGAFQQVIVGGLVSSIPAQQAMCTEQPQISSLGDRRTGRMFGHLIFRPARHAGRFARFLQDEVDLRHLESGQFDIDLELDQPLQLNRQQLPVPAGLLGEPVVGQDVGALIGVAQVRQPACGHCVDTKELGGFHAAVASDDLLRIVHQDRVAEAELLDALCDLPNLLPRMRSGIVWVRPQLAHRRVFNLHIASLEKIWPTPRDIEGSQSNKK